jgi:4-amino-4-deoxy-L-arabinose transferase-like glycosyltransferase
MILPPTTRRVVFWCIATLLLAITCVLHFWRIGSVPPGFTGDECSIAYNAYCIVRTGADESGNKFPLYFRSVSYQDPVMIYCSVPLVALFGLHEWVARLPSAVFYILASVAFGFLVQEHWRNKWLSLFGGLLFSLIPWGFPISRTVGPGQTALLFGLTAGWLFSLRAVRKRSFHCAVAAGAAFALAMYAYNAGRLMCPLLLVCFGVAFGRLLRSRWKVTAVFLTAYLTSLLPMIVHVVRAPGVFTNRFEEVSLFGNHPSWTGALFEIVTRYLDYFNPRFLFLTGDFQVRHHTGFGGELFWFTMPLILVGLYCLVRSFRTQPYYRFLALALLVYPAAASLTVDRMHSMRCVNGLIPWLLLAMLGARWLWDKRGTWRKLLLLMLCAGSVELALYLRNYFGPGYQSSCRSVFQSELADALKYCFHHLDDDQVLYISDSTFSPYGSIVNAELKPFLYAYVLFYGKIDPRKYQQTGFPMDTVRLYDNNTPKPGLLLHCNFRLSSTTEQQRARFAGDEFVVDLFARNDEPLPAGSVLLTRIPFPDPDVQFEIFKIP